MPQETLSLFSRAAPAVLVAVIGGLVKFLMDGKRDFWKLITNLVGAGFSGFLVYAWFAEYDVSPGHMCAMAGLAGTTGGAALEWVQDAVMRAIDIYTQNHFGGIFHKDEDSDKK